MKLKQLVSLMGVGLGLALAAGSASAISFWSFQDDDIDFILRANENGGFNIITSGAVQQNDIFLSALEIPTFTIDGNNAIDKGKEITGIAAVQLTTANPGSNLIWNFAPYSGGLNALLTAIGVPVNPNLSPYGIPGSGAMVALFINDATTSGVATSTSDPDLNLVLDASVDAGLGTGGSSCANLAACIYQASLGELLQVDGFVGNPGEFWFAQQQLIDTNGDGIPDTLPGTDVNAVKTLGAAITVATFNAGLSNLFNQVSPVLFHDPFNNICSGPSAIPNCVQVRAKGTIDGGAGLSNGAVAHSDFDAQKFVPEPATLALFGLGLLGLGARLRREA